MILFGGIMVEKKEKRLTQIREKVRMILADHPETRENDQLLTVMYLEEMGINGWDKWMDAAKRQSICLETIRRSRQVIQASGQYLPSDEAVIKRRRLQEVYARVMREGTNE
jgi:hypothetical protein